MGELHILCLTKLHIIYKAIRIQRVVYTKEGNMLQEHLDLLSKTSYTYQYDRNIKNFSLFLIICFC